jgi:dynein heavy chain
MLPLLHILAALLLLLAGWLGPRCQCPAQPARRYSFTPSGTYIVPPEGPYESYLTAIRGLPAVAAPEVFGLDANADISEQPAWRCCGDGMIPVGQRCPLWLSHTTDPLLPPAGKDQGETDALLEAALAAGGGGGGGGGRSRDEVLGELAADISARVPPVFDVEAARLKYPVDYYESMNTVRAASSGWLCGIAVRAVSSSGILEGVACCTPISSCLPSCPRCCPQVLTQELVRFNRLIAVIHSSLGELKKALKGQVGAGAGWRSAALAAGADAVAPAGLPVRRSPGAKLPTAAAPPRPAPLVQVLMSSELERVGAAMYDGKVPGLWAAQSYPSNKPLAGYVAELVARCDMLAAWVAGGPPAVYWISGFYFTHAFLTGGPSTPGCRCHWHWGCWRRGCSTAKALRRLRCCTHRLSPDPLLPHALAGIKQNYARRHRVPIDTVDFTFACMPQGFSAEAPDPDGAYVSGMFVDGARWDYEAGELAEPLPKVRSLGAAGSCLAWHALPAGAADQPVRTEVQA